MTNTSADDTASSSELVDSSCCGSANAGRYSGLTLALLIWSASEARRAQSTVGVLTLARAATVVPHDPAPITATRISFGLVIDPLRSVPTSSHPPSDLRMTPVTIPPASTLPGMPVTLLRGRSSIVLYSLDQCTWPFSSR